MAAEGHTGFFSHTKGQRSTLKRKAIFSVLITALMLLQTGCIMPDNSPVGLQPTTPPDAVGTLPVPPTLDPAVPAILLQQSVEGASLYLIRYTSAGQTCLSATFDQRMFATQRCGLLASTAVGFVDTLTHPTGRAMRVAYGLVNNSSISAVAFEFTNGANSNIFTENGGYAMILDDAQIPRRLHGINQYGNLVVSWSITG